MPPKRTVRHTNGAVEWEDPPPSRTNGAREAFWAALDANPGRWAIYRRDAKSSGTGLTFIRARGYETTSRTNPDGTFTIYARKPVSK